MARLQLEEIKADGTRLRALGPNAVTDRLFGILRHQGFQLSLGLLMLEKGLPGVAEHVGELRPGIRRAHVDYAHRLDPPPRRLNAEQVRGCAARDAVPELPLCRYQQALLGRI